MFQSATLKLTAWYLLIIMVISVLFSGLVYQSAAGEIQTRLEKYSQGLPTGYLDSGQQMAELRHAQAEQAQYNIFINLLYINILVLIGGGMASYFMAKRTLLPLEQAHDTEARFVGDASHELRTPLAVMKTELEVALKDSNLSKIEMRQILESNLEEVEKLTQLSHTLLALSKMDYAQLEYKELHFNTSVQSIIEKYNHEERIILKTKHNKVFINAHESSIDELLTILIDNALKYSPPKSPITITLSRRANKAHFVIQNQGMGIQAKDLPHIFDRFFRANNARSQTQQVSFGLGLSLAKQIVLLHNGELSVSSAPNKLTTFTVSLPILKKG